MEFQTLHMGQWLKNWMRQHGHTTAWLAKVLKVSTRHARNMFDRETFAIEDIRAVSAATGRDLFVFLLSRQEAEVLSRGRQHQPKGHEEAVQQAKMKAQAEVKQHMEELMQRMSHLETLLKQFTDAA